MGCDIHMVAERRLDDGWHLVGEAKYVADEDSYDMPEPYSDRNYNLFGMLANVRNGSGFAGVDTGDGFVPIAKRRGVPKDVSDSVRKWIRNWGPDGHSHTWLLVSELIAYDWNRTTKCRGVVSMPVYRYWRKEGGKPKSYCDATFGGGIRNVSLDVMEDEAANLERLEVPFALNEWGEPKLTATGPLGDLEQAFANMYTQIEWTSTYADCAGRFLTETLPKKVADWMETQVKRIENDTIERTGTVMTMVDYPGQAGGLRAIIEIAMSELRGVCHHHVSDSKKESS